MDCNKVGELIRSLRREKGLTQKQLADKMNISDKTISKWERGMGCPDVSLLQELSQLLEVNIEKILLGDLAPNDADGGNMKKMKFYVCPTCGNILTATGSGETSCCGRKLTALVAHPADELHQLTVAKVENDRYLTWDHPMKKDHFISFVAWVTYDRVLLIKLYPEQNPEVRLPIMGKGVLYFYCSQHGLWMNKDLC
ncbi:helix-turn-helix domain-containing protein [Aminipila butyrica]|uniref:Helix-turn-helix domain-containing protein n=1 Tax=Aminipila butyrica TaxID=433296 RepID=A0A858BT77_9FIRM|nr:helix-turn-helix domain-containing protein [Aminipila butyrica]QIB68767.1 helix-turn-helix domain-containing protein [Aminipila butyrica]